MTYLDSITTPSGNAWRVTIPALFGGTIVRYFPTHERAEQWARQCGKFDVARIEPLD